MHLNDLGHLLDEPRIELRLMNDFCLRDAVIERRRHLIQPLCGRDAQRRGWDVFHAAAETSDADVERTQGLLQGFGEGAADRHHFADRFHLGGQPRIGGGELFEGKARDLGDDIVDRGLERGRGRAAGDSALHGRLSPEPTKSGRGRNRSQG